MAVFQAFRALRPTPEKAERVAALPYDVVTEEEARETGDKNPFSFLHVDRAEIDLPEGTDPYDSIVYEKAKENLSAMEAEGIFIQDEKSCYYIYELTRRGKTQTGIAGCCSVDDYLNGVVKNMSLPEKIRSGTVFVMWMSATPIQDLFFMACRYTEPLLSLMEQWKKEHAPVYDFVTEDEIGHRVWVIDGDGKLSLSKRI